LIPFSQSTQAWRWRTREEQKQCEKKEKRHEDVLEKDADLDEEKSNETEEEEEVKVVGESSKSLLLRELMRALPPHHLLLKDRKKDKTVSYMDLLQRGPPPSESSKKYAKRK
jgi:hypothetical protein